MPLTPAQPIIKYGNNLAGGAPYNQGVPQAGWSVEEDCFGMLQSTVKFKWKYDQQNQFTTAFSRGTPHPYISELTLFKASMTVEKGEVLTVTADYVGLDSSHYSGGHSDPQIQMVSAASSESITAHPNFYRHFCTSISGEKVLAGKPPANGGFDPSLVSNPNRALWTPKVAGSGAVNNCQFIGFLPPQGDNEAPNIKAGVKSYYKPQLTLKVLVYVTTEVKALTMASYNGWVTDGDMLYLPDQYKKLSKAADGGGYPGGMKYTGEYTALINRNFLITNCSVERFGNLFKVTADLMLSGLSGWDPDIYPYVTGNP
jgi:hypothetical protein